jgi:polyisoprenoid-binding protein YceI
MRKYVIFLLLGFGMVRTGFAQLQIQTGSSVQFKAKNLGFSVPGSMSGLAGKIQFDPAQPDAASFDVTVDVSTINTDNGMRDDHLKGDGFFDAQKYPRIHLVSGKITQRKKDSYLFTGQLTIKKTTKDVSFPFTVTETGGAHRFQGSFTINRREYEVGGFSTVSDPVEVTLDVTAK